MTLSSRVYEVMFALFCVCTILWDLDSPSVVVCVLQKYHISNAIIDQNYFEEVSVRFWRETSFKETDEL